MTDTERRLQLQALLETILGSDQVHFQPPPNTKLLYPCIVYRRESATTKFADNNPYTHKKRYILTYIDREPDNEVTKLIAALPTCIFDRFYVADKLNHDVYKLFF